MIKTIGIQKTFKQGESTVGAVNNVDLEIKKGERVYIHGPSGAGKSTLLHILGGLRVPSSGRVEVDGKDIYRMSERKRSSLRNRKFGFIFQFYHLLPELTVLENVMLPGRIMGGIKSQDLFLKAKRLLDTVDMAGRLYYRPGQLSGGESQRTAIARALINSPDVLFCDEPTGNVDSKMSGEIYNIVKYISENEKMSVVVVSHQEVDSGFFHSEYLMKDGMLWRGDDFRNISTTEFESVKKV